MPTTPLIVPADIAVALGQAAPVANSIMEQQWDMWIADAEMLIDTRAAQLDIDLDDIDDAKLKYVIRESVVAHIKKPDDSTQVTVAVDDGSTSRSYKSGKGRVTILDEWWVLLGLTDPTGAFSVDMLQNTSLHLGWCDLYFGGLSCSCGVDIAGYPIFEGGGW